jgi:hypothetical protein
MSDSRTPFGPARAAQSDYEIGFGHQSVGSDPDPSLDEILVDPIVRRLMERDGVQMAELISLVGETKRRLR